MAPEQRQRSISLDGGSAKRAPRQSVEFQCGCRPRRKVDRALYDDAPVPESPPRATPTAVASSTMFRASST